ncbi:sigma-54 dependent transcriptional regulator [Shewanella sp. FJAT-52076]|uniref:sigma-54-dependent transcriptional regulator n=1 Tax=Shewanella sp. FJAT-52076 TaxID=2864202 RepID=UPI001C6574B1|nr:sigma-54 dependent transcriptional regulator [Shewanella sp. FJAT-52076]QYJ76752.1 sigma-54 dependent transcriptional regulator [Shewanella sp. FJAT-52076]
MNKVVQKETRAAGTMPRHLLLLSKSQEATDVSRRLAAYGWHCLTAASGHEAILKLSGQQLGVAVAMLCPRADTLSSDIALIQSHFPHLLWIALTDGKLDKACQWLLSARFIDYHHSPLDWDSVNKALGHADGMAKLLPVKTPGVKITDILGTHPCILRLKQDLKKLASTDETVLLSGETGTGKGLCAKWLHRMSARSDGPFIALNCGALPNGLIQSTLFGHEKGAFTGADRQHQGHIEQAKDGVLFLDEIADLPLELQVNLLHFLDDRQITRIGGKSPLKINCRIIFATHQNLEKAVDEGTFREDLYHRINVLRLHVPSLREYSTEVKLMAEAFLAQLSPPNRSLSFSDSAIATMRHYDWPGNVRELQNRIRRAVIMAETPLITPDDLGLSVAIHAKHRDLVSQRDELDVEAVLKAISDHKHNISAAARALNISRSTLYRLLKKEPS